MYYLSEVIKLGFSERLQLLRKEKGLSQEQLAELLNVSRQSVSKWESGQTYPETDKLIILSDLFEITLDYLLRDKNTECVANIDVESGKEEELRYKKKKINNKSIYSLVLGIISFFLPFIGLIFGIMGIVMSYKSVKEINNSEEKGIGLAVSGRIISIIGLVCQILLIVGFVMFSTITYSQ